MKVKAKIGVYNGGRYGRNGEYIAVIEPRFFKNGNMKKSDFKVIETLEITKKGYNYGNAPCSESIKEIIEVLEN